MSDSERPTAPPPSLDAPKSPRHDEAPPSLLVPATTSGIDDRSAKTPIVELTASDVARLEGRSATDVVPPPDTIDLDWDVD